MNKKRFSLGVTILLILMMTVFGAALTAQAATVCTPTSTVSVPYAQDGAGDFCFQTYDLCAYINSWNLSTLEVNGNPYTNVYVASSTIPPLNGMYIIHYVSTVAWGHFEIGGTCSASNPTPTGTNTPVVTITPTAPQGSLPDLTVVSMVTFKYNLPTPTPDAQGCYQPSSLERTGIRVTIQNIGTADAGAFVVYLSGSGVQQNISGLAAGQTLAVDYYAISFTTSRTATVDYTSVVTESDETNNSYTVTVFDVTATRTGTPNPLVCPPTLTPTPTAPTITPSGNLPDLTITAGYWTWDPNAYNSTDGCYNYVPVLLMKVTVKNNGTANAGAFVVDQDGLNQQTVSGLAAGQSIDLWFPFIFGTPPNSTWPAGSSVFTADSTNVIVENNESNNSFTIPKVAFTPTAVGTPKVYCMTVTPTPTTPQGSLPDLTVVSVAEFAYSPPTSTPVTQGCWQTFSQHTYYGLRVVIQNIGTANAGTFILDLDGVQQTINGLAVGQSMTVDYYVNTTSPRTRIATVDSTGLVAESNESNNTYTLIMPAVTSTATGTQPPTQCIPTLTPTRTPTLSPTPITPTPSGGTCSPVNATITAPFTKDGSGNLCWQSSNLGSYINSWNLSSLTVNGTNYTNVYASTGSLPAKINGYWYLAYNGPYSWSHFEAK